MNIVCNTIAEAWEKSIENLLLHGFWVPAERGNRAKELRNVLFTINSPFMSPIDSDKYAFSKEFLEEYSDNYLLSSNSSDSVSERINRFGVNKINQIDRIVEILSNHYFSRRAVISTWQQDLDLFSTHPPCLTSLQFQVRNNSLEISGILRSNDAWFAALPDLIAIFKLQKKVANELKLNIGVLNMLSINYHIYEMDFLNAVNVFK